MYHLRGGSRSVAHLYIHSVAYHTMALNLIYNTLSLLVNYAAISLRAVWEEDVLVEGVALLHQLLLNRQSWTLFRVPIAVV